MHPMDGPGVGNTANLGDRHLDIYALEGTPSRPGPHFGPCRGRLKLLGTPGENISFTAGGKSYAGKLNGSCSSCSP